MEKEEKSSKLFTEVESITKSIEARFKNFNVNIKEINWICPENSTIKEIRYNGKCFYASDFKLQVKIAKRGRKPKVKSQSEPISDFSFMVRKIIHREIKSDNYSRTSETCIVHSNCEIIYKCYTVLIFGGGRIVCVGITEKNCEDFTWCTNEVIKFLVEKGLKKEDLEIVKINKTLENFKFELIDKEMKIDLYKLHNYFVEKTKKKEVININLDQLFETVKDLVKAAGRTSTISEISTKNINNLVENSIQDFEIKTYLIAKVDLAEFFNILDEKKIAHDFEIFYEHISKKYTNKLTYSMDCDMKNMFFISYITNECFRLLNLCSKNKYIVVESTNIIDEKNTIVLLKKVNGRGITVKLFISGKIDILGSKTIDQTETIYNDLERIFKENPQILFHPDDW